MRVQYDPTTRQIVAYGALLGPSADGTLLAADVADTEVPKLSQPGTKTLNADETVSVDQTAYLAAQQQAQVQAQKQAATKQKVLSDCSGLVGLTLTKLNGSQLAALVEYFAYLHGVIDEKGTIQPTANWT